MEETHHQLQPIDSGAQHGQPTMRLQVPDVPAIKPEAQGNPGSFDATESELLHVIQSLIPLTSENLDQWTWEECRDYLYWCLDEGVLAIQDGRLVPVESLIPTAPLTHDTDEKTPKSAEDIGFLPKVERTKPVIASKLAISTKDETDDHDLKSVVYASTSNMPMNAHKRAQEGAEECSHVFQPDGAGTIG